MAIVAGGLVGKRLLGMRKAIDALVTILAIKKAVGRGLKPFEVDLLCMTTQAGCFVRPSDYL